MPTATQTRAPQAQPAQAREAKGVSSRIVKELKLPRDLASLRDGPLGEAVHDGTATLTEVAAEQRNAWRIIEHWATKQGLDDGKFEAIRARAQAELQRVADARAAAAVAQSASVLQPLIQAVERKRKAFETVIAAAPPVQPAFVTLDSPYQIWASPGVAMQASSIVPWNSFAKVTFETSDTSAWKEIGFDFAWENPSDAMR